MNNLVKIFTIAALFSIIFYAQTANSIKDNLRLGFSAKLIQNIDNIDAAVAIKMWGNTILDSKDILMQENSKIYGSITDIKYDIENNKLRLFKSSGALAI